MGSLGGQSSVEGQVALNESPIAAIFCGEDM